MRAQTGKRRKTQKSVLALFIAGIGTFLLLHILLLLRHHDVRWDEAVFLSMGKYIFSNGTLGFWEALRPPILPLFLGFFDVLGNPVILGEIFMILVGITGSIALYVLLQDEIDKRFAALACLTLLFSNIWFWYSGMLFTGVLSATFILIAFVLAARNRFILAGIFSGIAFLTRFPAGLGFGALFLVYGFRLFEKPRFSRLHRKEFLHICYGFAIPVVLWCITNVVRYQEQGVWSFMYPLLQGSTNVFFQNTWMYSTAWWFYLAGIISLLPLSFFAIAGLRYSLSVALRPLLLQSILALLFFSTLINRQWRFAILILPGIIALSIIGAYTLAKKSKVTSALSIVFVLFLAQLCVLITSDVSMIHDRPNTALPDEQAFQYFSQHPISGTIIVTHPVASYYSPNPSIPVYYEFRDAFYTLLDEKTVSGVFYTPYSFPCLQNDTVCASNMARVEERLQKDFLLAYTLTAQNITYNVYTRT